ncbi:MAG: hypothetical protein V1808_01415 [Candidatus Daviesbacteria bacterium]
MVYQYLKDLQHYVDLYDLHTIEECLDYYSSIKKDFEEERNSDKFKKFSQEKFDCELKKMLNLTVNLIRGERFRNKAETIKKWMDEDRKQQEKYDNAIPPTGIICKVCSSPTTVESKDLFHSEKENSQVLFMFRCTKCKKGEAYYEDGTEWVFEPPKCPECGAPLNHDYKDVNEVMTTTYFCPKCSYKKEDVYDFKKSRLEREKKETKEKELLVKYREVYCLDYKKGQEYIETVEAMEVGHEVYEEELQKYDSPAYQYAVQLKKISVADLEKLLNEHLEKEKYIKLSFDKPEIGQYVIIPFNVQDADSSRKEYTSIANLQGLLKESLEGTNWRLLSNSAFYRLGYISGKLKGYEREEDFIELSGKKKEPKPSKIDPEKRMKYSNHNVVQLARLSGEMQGIENMRKKRLETEPGGFHLEEDGIYTCPICGNSMSGVTTWYDKWGMKCINCKRNIDAGVIPPEINDYETKGETWLTKWHIEDRTGLHPATISKLIRTGELKARHLKDEHESTYYEIFMVDENKELLKKYPKKPKT